VIQKSSEFPYVGLSQSVRFCTESGSESNVFITFDAGLDWFNREQRPQSGPVRIIDDSRTTIAGVRVNSLHEVVPVHLHGEIEKALKKLTLNMKYTKPIDEERENGKRSLQEYDRGM
jgi:hypothetical protein